MFKPANPSSPRADAMRVVGPNAYTAVSGRGAARKRKSGGEFAAESAPSHEPKPDSTGVGAVRGVEGLLSLQEVDDRPDQRQRAVKRGNDLLDELDGIHLDLLAGRVSDQRLERLIFLLNSRGPSGDPNLDSIIAEIEVRAHVELAKRQRFTGGS